MSSNTLDANDQTQLGAYLGQADQRHIEEDVKSEELLRDRRSGTVTTSKMNEQSAVDVEVLSLGHHGVENRRVRRQETDGGVRLMGGRVGEEVQVADDECDQLSMSTLPPPYSSDYGDT